MQRPALFQPARAAQPLQRRLYPHQRRGAPHPGRPEVLSFIRQGLLDFSISRSYKRARGWGIAVPGDPEQIMYVWFDALGNYITALDYAQEGALYQRYWRDNPARVHMIGKGFIRFHAVYWPAMLLSAGLPPPSTIFVHGYVTVDGEKISKSLGNVVDPVELAGKYGADALRYYLLREIPPAEDGDFTLERFVQSYNANLADQLGNLLSRVVSMVGKYYGGSVPAAAAQEEEVDKRLKEVGARTPEVIDAAMGRYSPQEALMALWELIAAANKYVGDVAPWQLAKRRKEDPQAEARLATALYNLVEALRLIAHLCYPFIPATAEGIARQLGIALAPERGLAALSAWGHYPAGTAVVPGQVLFPKFELGEGSS